MRQNVGCAKLVKDFKNGTITSTWAFYAGVVVVGGVAKGEGTASDSFFGEYDWDMVDDFGNETKWRMFIEEENGRALVTCYDKDGALKTKGVGVIEGDVMFVGWGEWEEEL